MGPKTRNQVRWPRVKNGGRLVLSGLLEKQGKEVLGAYQTLRFVEGEQMVLNNWLTLTLKKT